MIGEALGIEFEDWTDHLPCNGAIAVQTESTQPAVPYTRSIAHEAGWQWRIPLQHRTGNGIVYCNDFLDENGALDKLLQTVKGKTITDPNFIKFRAGTRKKQWHKNCIAVGLSSGFMEPLESTSIHLIQRNILRFIRMMPTMKFLSVILMSLIIRLIGIWKPFEISLSCTTLQMNEMTFLENVR